MGELRLDAQATSDNQPIHPTTGDILCNRYPIQAHELVSKGVTEHIRKNAISESGLAKKGCPKTDTRHIIKTSQLYLVILHRQGGFRNRDGSGSDDVVSGDDDSSGGESGLEDTKKRLTEKKEKATKKQKRADQMVQVTSIQNRMNGSTSIICDNTGRTGPLKKLPNLGNEDALSCKTIYGLGKIVHKYKAHLPLAPGMKQSVWEQISNIFHRDEVRLIPSNYKPDRAHSNSHNPGDYENLTDADELAVKLFTEKDLNATSKKDVTNEKNAHKDAVVLASDFLAPLLFLPLAMLVALVMMSSASLTPILQRSRGQ
eukprot:scaffold206805_cov42-Attheya_sp.AAC.1